ncbi:hypothetical protein [Paenibacillus nasutitermitis]|uniref:Uncharacterized protein n=1 Tax=Paenibacillus nasutitermitis TaxID=1652958 RepID=A0A917DMJ3_9BACL|nr:hypothetical protein [Paenibacillus nasutitermitis]GGD48798.1 hypothetical protein GCM10010911_02890 [Paenibacillus nasutitermitis]
MNTYMLSELTITHKHIATRLAFASAQLVIVTEGGFRLWYIDLDGMTQSSLLRDFEQSEDIRVELKGTSVEGSSFTATGYLHPNTKHHAAAIRGDGKLEGLG